MKTKLTEDIIRLIRGKDIAQGKITASAYAYAEAASKRKDIQMYMAESRAFRF